MDYFLLGTDDKTKAVIFTSNHLQRTSIREDAKRWVLENYMK